MTMNYCGRCGSANGRSARYCRQCGADLSSQSAFSTPSAPLNVEFSSPPSRSPKQDPKQESINESINDVSSAPLEDLKESYPDNLTQSRPTEAPRTDSLDPVVISQTLRRVRASGPLIIEAVKKSQDDMKQIFSQGTEGTDKSRQETGQTAPQAIVSGSRSQGSVEFVSEPKSLTGNTGEMSRQQKQVSPFAGSLNRSGNAGNIPPSGPSSVLAQASGLHPESGMGPKIRLALIALALIIATGTYYIFRDNLLKPHSVSGDNRDLMRVEDQSAEYVNIGDHEREQGNYEAALDNFQKALLLTPNNPNVHFLIAQTYFSCGRLNEALDSYKSVLRISPENLEARIKVAEIYRSRGNWNAAYQEYQRIITLDQYSVQATVALEALEQHQAGEQPAAATKSALKNKPPSQVNPVLPTLTSSQTDLALLPPKLDLTPGVTPPSAINLPPSEENPDPRALADSRKKLGLRLYNVKEYRASINEFLAALRLTPDDKDLYYFLGSAYYGLGQQALAHDYFKRVDKGQYVQVSQSGAQRTEKAAQQEKKRRMDLLQNEPKNEFNQESKRNNNLMPGPPKGVSNSIR